MKIDMSKIAVTKRLQQVAELRRTCLVLASSSTAKAIRKKYAGNALVKRTSFALGQR